MGKQPIVIERSMQNHSMAAIRKQDMMRGMQAYDDWCTAARAEAETTPALDIAPQLDRATMAMAVRYSLHQLEIKAPAREWRYALRRTRWSRSQGPASIRIISHLPT